MIEAKKKTAPEGASKKRFNAVDILIVAVTLLLLFAFFMENYMRTDKRTQVILTLAIDASDAEQMSYAGITASEGSRVYDASGEVWLGTLKNGYLSGDKELTVVLGDEVQAREKFVCNQTVGVRVGKLICRCAVVKDIEEVVA
ncbi:MAG: hypothetical protein IJU52_07240 [Clostridia bacterium]|nr:hypothetical protein [Clostridia bacterium]